MHGDTTPPRRRKLPVLGMTTVGLAVGAGSLGLYRGAAAVPLAPPDRPTWTTAEVRSPAPPPQLATPMVTPTAAEGPPVPAVPSLPSLPELPAPAKAPDPTPWPPLPRPTEAPVTPAPVMPVTPAGPLLPAMPSLGGPDLVKPIEVAPFPVKVAVSEVAPPPRDHAKVPAVVVKPVAPVAQPVQLAEPVRPIVPLPADYPLPPSVPGFKFNGSPEVLPTPTTPGALTSLDREHPGETPVIPTRQALKSAALGVALAASPVTAAEPPATMPKADAAKTEAAKPDAPKDVVAELKAEFEKMRADVKADRKVREELEDIVKGKLNKETNKTEPSLLGRFNDLEAKMTRLEEALKKVDVSKFEETIARLEKKLEAVNNSTTTQKPDAAAAKPMPGPAAATPPAIVGAKATVRIVNDYPVPISMILNGNSYRVEPSSTKSVEIPAGGYTYELLHAGSQATTATIKDNDSITLRVR